MKEQYYKGYVVWQEGYGWYAQPAPNDYKNELSAYTLPEILAAIDIAIERR